MSGKHRFVAAVAFASIVSFAASADVTGVQLYSFSRTQNGDLPNGGLPNGITADKHGVLYGTTVSGGAFSHGTAFKFYNGDYTVLHAFKGKADGDQPRAGLTVTKKGILFGTTCGGDTAADVGTIFEILANGNYKKLHVFKKRAHDGECPYGELVLGLDRAYYGTSVGDAQSDAGNVFRISPKGDFSVVYSFAGGSDGQEPVGPLLSDGAGTFYGTTMFGGAYGAGTVFSVTSGGGERVIYSFSGSSDGFQPRGGVIADASGNLYGTTYAGGAFNFGTVFKISKDGIETVVHSFNANAQEGLFPAAPLLMDKGGNIYGTTLGDEKVFEITAAGEFKTLYDLASVGGRLPYGALYMDKAGAIYGTTQSGGTGNAGIIYKLTLQ